MVGLKIHPPNSWDYQRNPAAFELVDKEVALAMYSRFWQLRHPRTRMEARLAGLAIALALGVAGCGDDGDGGPGVAIDSATEKAKCSAVGTELEARATKTVSIQLKEYSFSPSTVEVGAGVVTFATNNAGKENHELAFLPGGGEVPLTAGGEPDEDALGAAGAFELEAFGPGQSCNATYDMKPGTYALFCIVTSADGSTHYQKGMRGQLVVA